MREPTISRRWFLAGGAAALAAVACGRTTGSGAGPGVQTTGPLQVVTTSVEHVVGDRRLAFAVFDGNAPLRGDGGGTVLLRDPDGEQIGPLELRTFTTERGMGGEAQPQGPADTVFVTEVDFSKSGFYDMAADLDIGGRSVSLSHRVGVGEAQHTTTVAAGGEAISVATPVTGEGGEQPCTRNPACGLHEVSLDDALAARRPLLVTFSTPEFCSSRICGPALDAILAAKDSAGEGVEFIHVEIYQDVQAGTRLEAVEAWGISGEPFTFMIDSEGTVRERLSGPVAQWEFEDALRRLKS